MASWLVTITGLPQQGIIVVSRTLLQQGLVHDKSIKVITCTNNTVDPIPASRKPKRFAQAKALWKKQLSAQPLFCQPTPS